VSTSRGRRVGIAAEETLLVTTSSCSVVWSVAAVQGVFLLSFSSAGWLAAVVDDVYAIGARSEMIATVVCAMFEIDLSIGAYSSLVVGAEVGLSDKGMSPAAIWWLETEELKGSALTMMA